MINVHISWSNVHWNIIQGYLFFLSTFFPLTLTFKFLHYLFQLHFFIILLTTLLILSGKVICVVCCICIFISWVLIINNNLIVVNYYTYGQINNTFKQFFLFSILNNLDNFKIFRSSYYRFFKKPSSSFSKLFLISSSVNTVGTLKSFGMFVFIVQYWFNNSFFYFFHYRFYKFILVIVNVIINYLITSTFHCFEFQIFVLNQNINIFYQICNAVKIHLNRVVWYTQKLHWKIMIKFNNWIFGDINISSKIHVREARNYVDLMKRQCFLC